jgi:putative addiction module killer protein
MPMSQNLLKKKYYKTSSGSEPAREYIASLDKMARARVFVQLDRLKAGNPGKGHGVGRVQELKIDYGPGYRVYYSIVESGEVVLLLVAGDKTTQREDINTAEQYLVDFMGKKEESK